MTVYVKGVVFEGVDFEQPDHWRLAAYVARGTARPAFRRALDAQLAGFTGEPPAGFREWLEKQHREGGSAMR